MFLSNFSLDIFFYNLIFTNQGTCCKTKPMYSRIITNKCLLLNVPRISISELGSFLSIGSTVVFSIHYPFMLKCLYFKAGREQCNEIVDHWLWQPQDAIEMEPRSVIETELFTLEKHSH